MQEVVLEVIPIAGLSHVRMEFLTQRRKGAKEDAKNRSRDEGGGGSIDSSGASDRSGVCACRSSGPGSGECSGKQVRKLIRPYS